MSYQFHIKALSALARLRLLNVLPVRLRRLNPRRLDFILDLKLVSGLAALSLVPAFQTERLPVAAFIV